MKTDTPEFKERLQALVCAAIAAGKDDDDIDDIVRELACDADADYDFEICEEVGSVKRDSNIDTSRVTSDQLSDAASDAVVTVDIDLPTGESRQFEFLPRGWYSAIVDSASEDADRIGDWWSACSQKMQAAGYTTRDGNHFYGTVTEDGEARTIEVRIKDHSYASGAGRVHGFSAPDYELVVTDADILAADAAVSGASRAEVDLDIFMMELPELAGEGENSR